MTRKQFLQQIWKYVLRPLMWVAIIYFCVRFVAAALSENGSERMFWYMGIGAGALVLVLGQLSLLMAKVSDFISARLSPLAKRNLRRGEKVLEFGTLLLLGAGLYHLWQHDRVMAILFFLVLLVTRIQHILREEKTENTTSD